MSSRYIEATYHSSLLMPESVAMDIIREKDKAARDEKMLLWTEAHSASHFMKSGDRVHHIGNLEQRMFVSRIVRKKYGDEKEKRQKIVGVEVYFWESQADQFL